MMSRMPVLALVALMSLAGCASGPRPVCKPTTPCPGAADAQPPKIPLAVLMANSGKTDYRISRLGDRIAWLEVHGPVQALVTREAAGGESRRLVEVSDGRLWPWQFAPDGRSLLYVVDDQGDERWRVRQVFLDGSADRELLSLGSHVGVPIAMEGDRLLVPQIHEVRPKLWSLVVVEVDLRTGERKTVESLPRRRVIRWFADRSLKVRAALALGKDHGKALLVRDAPGTDWRILRTWTKQQPVEFGAFSRDGRFLFLSESRDTDKHRMGWLNLENGDLLEVFYDPDREPVDSIVLDDEPVAVATEHARRRWHLLNDKAGPDLETLTDAFGGDFEVTGQSRDGRRWLIRVDQDLAPPRTFLYDRQGRQLDLLGAAITGLLDHDLAPMEAFTIPTRDGLALTAYLTRPPGEKGHKTPLVLLVHGGPEARDHWGFDRWAQFLASRGYAALQVNFRGSAGFGRAFAQAGRDNRVGGKTPQDLADAVAWAKTELKVQEDRIAVMGLSYGGFATLASLAQDPDLYACGVDGFGISELLRQNRLTVPAKTSLKDARDKVFDKRREQARGGSPIRAVQAVRAPLLIAHGANDPRVPIDQSGDFVDELRDAGGCAEYVVYPDEGHGFRRQANRLDFARRLEAFLARHLCGRSEPPAPVPGTSAEPH